jgi:DnaJ-class molecular chaperone
MPAHPHCPAHTPAGAKEAFQRVITAAEMLADAGKRRQYDAQLKASEQAAAAGSSHADDGLEVDSEGRLRVMMECPRCGDSHAAFYCTNMAASRCVPRWLGWSLLLC